VPPIEKPSPLKGLPYKREGNNPRAAPFWECRRADNFCPTIVVGDLQIGSLADYPSL
jgi:hypothetical protein